MHRLGTMACVVATLMLFGCDSTAGPSTAPFRTPTTSTASTTSASASTAPSVAADVVTPAQLRAAVRDLVRRNTGTFRVRASGISGVEADSIPVVDGSWSLRPRLSSTEADAIYPEQGEVVIRVIGVGRQVFSQVLADGTFFTPQCWLRVPTPQGTFPAAVAAVLTARSDGQQVTMGLARVLSDIGFQSGVNKLGRSLRGRRVPVHLRVEDGRIKGWEVTGSDLVAASQGLAASEAKTTFLTLLAAIPNVSWLTTVQDLGQPVFIRQPAASSIVETDGTNQEACT